jgi:hypothetical protein
MRLGNSSMASTQPNAVEAATINITIDTDAAARTNICSRSRHSRSR